MAMWFVWALCSAVFAGLHTFCVRVASGRGYHGFLIVGSGSFFTLLIGVAATFLFGGWAAYTPFVVMAGLIFGVIFVTFSVMRVEALKYIDSSIFFPLYKVIGPALTALFALMFLGEHLTTFAIIGIVLSCMVPLLLITRHEQARQKNLKWGITLMLIGTTLASINAAGNAWVVHGHSERSLALLVLSCVSAICGALLQLKWTEPHLRIFHILKRELNRDFVLLAIVTGIVQFFSFYSLLMAFAGGSAAIVYSVNAHYILIPVLLSIWIYREHWNWQKSAALVVSLLALVFLHP